MGKILVKVHESYRLVVAVCDEDVFGRKLAEGKRVLDVSGVFFSSKDDSGEPDGKAMSSEDAESEIVRCANEDATFNFVGRNSVELAKRLGLVKSEGVMEIDGVPFALVLL
jgi:hypothetical protein